MIPPYNFMDSSRDGIFGKLIIRYACVNSKKNLRKQIIFYPKGMGGAPAPAEGARRFGVGNAPPILFLVLPKRERAVHGPREKNAFAVRERFGF